MQRFPYTSYFHPAAFLFHPVLIDIDQVAYWKSATLKGKTTDPSTGKEMDVKQTFTVVNDNTQKLEMFMTHDGQEFKTMEITLTRMK